MSLNAPDAAMVANEYSWLVHKLCGPNVDSGDVHAFGRRLSGSPPLRSPGTLAETVVRRVKENGTEMLERNIQRLANALNNVQSGVHKESRGLDVEKNLLGDASVLSAPLMLQYDDVSIRQHERLDEQRREVEELRQQVLDIIGSKSDLHDLLHAANQHELTRCSGYENGEMLISRIESYEKENVLLKEQIALMSKEVKLLRVEKEACIQEVVLLKREILERDGTERQSNYNVSKQSMQKLVGNAKDMTSQPQLMHSGGAGMFLKESIPEMEELQSRALIAEHNASRTTEEVMRLTKILDAVKRENQVNYDELSDAKDYIVLLESRLEAYQTQSLNIYRQVKNAMQATEHATIQRDQAHARERALSEEVDVLHERLKSSAGKNGEHAMRLMHKQHAVLSGDIISARRKIELLERRNSELEATQMSARNENLDIADTRHVHVLPESKIEVLPSAEGNISTSARFTRPQAAVEAQLELRILSAEKALTQRLKRAEDTIESQRAISSAMEVAASNTIKVLREKLKRARRKLLSKQSSR